MQRVEIPRRPVASLETGSANGKNMLEFRIIHPDQTMYALILPSNCTGQDCLNKMCDILGIVERDYFGLQYVDKTIDCNIWINKRLRLKKQLKKTKPPYKLLFVVKFFTDIELLLQPSTIEAFYKDLKFQMHHGLTRVPDSKKALIGATIAQADFGDVTEHNSTTTAGQTSAGGLTYPDYFPNWSSGDGLLIAKEHKKLKGVSKRDAQCLMLTTVYQVEGFGMQYYPAVLNNEMVVLGVGARYVAVYDTQLSLKKRVSFYNITQVSFGYKFFAFSYLTREDGTGLPISKKIVFHVPNHSISRSLFRSVTEAQVFLHQTTVSPSVFNHSDLRNARLKRFCQKVFRMEFETHYYYDLHRTKNESYRHYWQVLNQVQGESSLMYEPAPTSLAYINLSVDRNEESSTDPEEDTSSQSHDKTALIWGLSTSSSNLAKQLLPSTTLQLSHSESIMTYTPTPPLATTSTVAAVTATADKRLGTEYGGHCSTGKSELSTTEEETIEPLSGAQSKAFQQLLLKIQDERLCNVCMDELITSVFCPCGHYVACNGCAKRLDKCPVCRHSVAYVQSVYTKY